MRKLEKYFTDTPLQDDVAKLSDPKLSFKKHRSQVNELVLNVVIKYLAEYLKISEGEIGKIRDKIRKEIDKSRTEDRKFNPYLTGQCCENIYGMSPGVDLYPLNCHADIKRTAAIFKEIAFNDRFKADDRFRGIDMGCGTGVLTLAMAIAGARRQVEDLLCIGVEIRERTAKKSNEALKSIIGDKAKIIHGDLLRNGLMAKLLKEHQPQYWLSETIDSHPTSGTPCLDIFSHNLGLSVTEDVRKQRSRQSDPYVALLEETIKNDKDFIEKVRNGDVAMFPNVVGGLFKPNKENTRILLATGPGRVLKLFETDSEFRNYEGLGLSSVRWTVAPSSEDEGLRVKIEKRVQHKAKGKTCKPSKPNAEPKQLELWEEE